MNRIHPLTVQMGCFSLEAQEVFRVAERLGVLLWVDTLYHAPNTELLPR